MKRILKFKLSGKFGFFKYPFTSPNKLKKTFSIPPRTTILGILGSIIGLNGFQTFDGDFPEFYEKLNHIKMFIGINKIPQKTLITYNSLNSFAKNISKDPNVMIKEEILLNPEYEIGLLLDDSIEEDKKILENITKERIKSNYHIYMGKNEFFAEISNVQVFDEKDFKFEELDYVESLNSIIFKKIIDLEESLNSKIVLDSFSKNIIFEKGRLKSEIEEIAFILNTDENKEIYFNKKVNLLYLNNNFYYLF